MFVFKDSKQKALCNLILKSYFAKIAQDEAMTDFNLSELRDLNRKIEVESVIKLEFFEKNYLMCAIELFAKMLKKGSEVAIEGKLTHRSYDDKDGNKRYITEVVANELVSLSK